MVYKFEVGDTVYIENDLVIREYPNSYVTSEMISLSGKKAIIKEALETVELYILDVDGGRFHWEPECLCYALREEVKPKRGIIGIGSIVTIREDLSTDAHYDQKYYVVSRMLNYRGKRATVIEMKRDGSFHLDIDEEQWNWTSTMVAMKITPEEFFEELMVKS